MNCTAAIRPLEIVPGPDPNDPYGVKTALGWGVVGTVGKTASHFAFTTSAREVSPSVVGSMLDREFIEYGGSLQDNDKMSIEDRKFMDILKKGIHVREDGHFEMPLPWKDDSKMPNNRTQAAKRLAQLRARLLKNPKLREDYLKSMDDMLHKGYAERVPKDELNLSDGTVWYIPHHGVYHPVKRDKCRVVFDASAEFEGTSLNKRLLQGPDLTNNLTGVLIRFRRERYAFACDLEAMFMQCGVDARDRNYLRFLWWEGGDLMSEPVEYRMRVSIFGATSSPGMANFALKSVADEFESKYGEEAADFVRKQYYMDDGLDSESTTKQAINIAHSSADLVSERGFREHKFVAKDREILKSMPQSELGKNLQKLNLQSESESLPIERTLGLEWHVESDDFGFAINLKDKPLTRRGILSTVASVYDPLGLVSPVILQGKAILKELCSQKLDWDADVPEDVRMRWERCRTDLMSLSQLKIPRCYKTSELGPDTSVELHSFSDASESGYGQCSYLKYTDESGRIETSLVMAKSRVTPQKVVTIPRLELVAALTSAKIAAFTENQLQMEILAKVFYTDSQVVLGYISNEAKRFHIFVSNRVQQIRDLTEVKTWRHVVTDANPADLASRGMSATDLLASSLWWKGPEFLRETTNLPAPDIEAAQQLSEDDPEVKRTAVTLATRAIPQPYPSLYERFGYFASWFRLKHATALCLRYVTILQECVRKKRAGDGTNEEAISRLALKR
ncbi:uncharacterized protein LOC135503550 [Lineus longissimus]|uniref:uncharacterized protein LOC135503550 n=1 Tax=Lineus longissimus TaxID=88925 RepID=UPI00315DCE7A